MSEERVTLAMVKEAQERLKGVAQKTSLSYATSVSEVAGCDVWLKLENLQRTGSFKLRGAYNKVASLTPEERENPDILNPSRRRRISAGCGVKIQDVNRMIKQFKQMRDMMGKVSNGDFSGMEGLFGNGMGGKLAKMSMSKMVRKNKKKKLRKLQKARRRRKR